MVSCEYCRDGNIPTQFDVLKSLNLPGDRSTYSSRHNGSYLQGRHHVLGPCARQTFEYKRPLRTSSILKNSSSPLGVTMIGWWPLFIPRSFSLFFNSHVTCRARCRNALSWEFNGGPRRADQRTHLPLDSTGSVCTALRLRPVYLREALNSAITIIINFVCTK